ncbi:TPA: tyrosine-type recombinase/integrase [Escherichia coli]
MTDINHDNTVYPSSSFSGSPYLYQQVYTPSPDTRLTQINLLGVAKPQLVRRANGRYTIRFRLKGQTTPFLSVSTRSTDRRVATMRQRELAATAKAFMLDRPEVSLQELKEHLRSMAEQFLTDASDDYWNGLEVATLVDEKSNLKELAATQALSLDQQKGIRLALEVLTAAQQRVDTGDTSGLIDIVMNNPTDYSTICDSMAILSNEQGVSPEVFTQERLTDGAYGFDLASFLSWVDTQPDEGPLFGMTPSAYSSWFNSRVMTEALGDAENVSLHSLRHWLATRMKERGVNLVDAQGILGHSSQSITYDLYGKGHAVGRLAEVLKTALL